MYKDEKGNNRYEISESLDIMNQELARDQKLMTILSKVYLSKSKKAAKAARNDILFDLNIQDWLICYSMGVLLRNISDYMVYYFCGCPSDFSNFTVSDWIKSEQFMISKDVTFVHESFKMMRKISNEMCHIYTDSPKEYILNGMPVEYIKNNLQVFYYNDWGKTMNFKGIIEVMAKVMLEKPSSSMGIHNHHYFILLKNELELLAEIAADKSQMSIVEYLFDRPSKVYTISLLLGLLSRRVLEGKLTAKIANLTTDQDLLKIRCDWDIPNKIGFLRKSNYQELAKFYTYVNDESKPAVHPLIGIDEKNITPEIYFKKYKSRLKKSTEILSDVGKQKGYIALLLCIFGSEYGLHKFYLGQWKWGVAYLLTGGLWGFGEIVDYFLFATGRAKNTYDQPPKGTIACKSAVLFKIINYVLLAITIISKIEAFINGEIFK